MKPHNWRQLLKQQRPVSFSDIYPKSFGVIHRPAKAETMNSSLIAQDEFVFFGKGRLDHQFGLGVNGFKIIELDKAPDSNTIEITFSTPDLEPHAKLFKHLEAVGMAIFHGAKTIPVLDYGYFKHRNRVFKIRAISSLEPVVICIGWPEEVKDRCFKISVDIEEVKRVQDSIPRRTYIWDFDAEDADSYVEVTGQPLRIEQEDPVVSQWAARPAHRTTHEAIAAAVMGYKVRRAKWFGKTMVYDSNRAVFVVNHRLSFRLPSGRPPVFFRPHEVLEANDKILRKHKTDWIIEI